MLARTGFESNFMGGLCSQNRVASNETMLARFASPLRQLPVTGSLTIGWPPLAEVMVISLEAIDPSLSIST